jgi:hypothetical protein
MPRNAKHPAKAAVMAAKPGRPIDPLQSDFTRPELAGGEAFAEFKAGAEMATIMVTTYAIGLLALGVELPLGVARSFQLASRGANG